MTEARNKEYYTVSEVAEKFDVSPSTVWRWIKDGKLSAYRVGGRSIRIKNKDLESLVSPAYEEEGKRVELSEGYNPEAARKALYQTAGTWADLDIDAIIEDIYRAREEDVRIESKKQWPTF